MDFQGIRKEYENQGIDESRLKDDPIDQFQDWYDVAVDKCPGQWFEANAMALSTCDLSGRSTVRWVLLKGITNEGFVFYTNYESLKGQQLAANPVASFGIHWPYLGRQVRVEGVVSKTSREQSEEYFHSRPRGSQLGAAASAQSHVVGSRDELDETYSRFEKELDGSPVPLPENWGGYLIQPTRIEFWQGRLGRLHDRIVYEREQVAGDWKRIRLCP